MPGLLFCALEAVSVASAAHLWIRARGSVVRKLLWTPVVLVPVMGPLFYGAIYDAPSEQDEDLRAAETDTDTADD
jgi:hypothetical protein